MEAHERTAFIGLDVSRVVGHRGCGDCLPSDDSRPRSGVFTPSDALEVFNANFLDYEFSRIWVLKRLHPDGAHCPGCAAPIPDHKLQRFWSNGRLACRKCGKYFSALTGTFIAGCQIDFRNLVLMAVFLALGVHDSKIATITGMSAENVRLWRRKFMVI